MKNISLSILSEFRSELMGFAMLMVVFYHIAIDINSSLFAFLHYHGGFGVDVFLLLSGLGLYFSTKKGLNLKEFYLKRIIDRKSTRLNSSHANISYAVFC